MSLTQQEIIQEAQFAFKLFQSRYSDLCGCFNHDDLLQALGAEGALVGPSKEVLGSDYDCEALCSFIESNFLALLDRGALVNIQRMGLSDEATEQLEKMEAKVSKVTVVTTTVAPIAPAKITDVEQCAQDFKTLPSRAFSQKWLGVKRTVYEKAFQQGLI